MASVHPVLCTYFLAHPTDPYYRTALDWYCICDQKRYCKALHQSLTRVL